VKFFVLSNKKHFNFNLLRNSFQTALLRELHASLGDSFKKVIASIYSDHKNGVLCPAKPNKCMSVSHTHFFMGMLYVKTYCLANFSIK